MAMFSYSRLADIYAYFKRLFTGMLLIKGASLAELVCDLRCTGDFISIFGIVEVNLLLYTSWRHTGGSRRVIPLILNFGIMWREWSLHAPPSLPPAKDGGNHWRGGSGAEPLWTIWRRENSALRIAHPVV